MRFIRTFPNTAVEAGMAKFSYLLSWRSNERLGTEEGYFGDRPSAVISREPNGRFVVTVDGRPVRRMFRTHLDARYEAQIRFDEQQRSDFRG